MGPREPRHARTLAGTIQTMLNDRDIASAVWLLVALALGLRVVGIRQSLAGVVRALLQPAIVAIMVVFTIWIGALLALGQAVGLWDVGLAKDASIWFVLSGLALLLNPQSTKAGEAFFRRAFMAAVGLTAFLEFYGNLVVFPLVVELLLQPTVVFLVLMRTAAGQKPEYKAAKKLFDRLSVGVGLCLLAMVSFELVQGWNTLDKAEIGRSLALPIWLTVGSFPLIYIVGIYNGYEWVLRQAGRVPRDRRTMWRVRVSLLLGFRLSRDIIGFVWPWPERVADARSLKEGLCVVSRYRARLRIKKARRRSGSRPIVPA